MLKKKIPNRLLGTLVSVSLLNGTLTASLPLSDQFTPFARTTRNRLKKEVDQRITAVKKVVNGLNIAKILVPSALVGAGIFAATVVALLFLIPALRYRKALKAFTEGTKELLIDKPYKTISEAILSLKELNLLKQKDITRLETYADKEFLRGITPAQITKKIKKWFRKNIIADSVAAIASGTVTVALSGLAGATSFFLLKFLGLSKKTVAATLENVKRLETIEKNNPGILNAKQKSVIAQFKKLQKNPAILGIIQNLQLRAALEKIVITAMKQHPSLARRIGTTKADKEFSSYIKLKWQEKNLQKAADAYTAMNVSGLKVSSTKRELRKTKKRIESLEDRYPGLKEALKYAAQKYSQQAKSILEALKKELMKTAKEPKEFRLPVIPL